MNSRLMAPPLSKNNIEIYAHCVRKHFGIQKGELYLLASTKNRIHDIPYFPEIEVERIKESLLRN